VLPIWEGTTNVLSLDVWRAIARTGALAPWLGDVRATMSRVKLPRLTSAIDQVVHAAEVIERYVARAQDDAARERGARRLAFAIARTAAAARMIDHAAWGAARDDADRGAVDATLRWTARGLARELESVPGASRP
jgi:putative acyl-CoA dehydrogenase